MKVTDITNTEDPAESVKMLKSQASSMSPDSKTDIAEQIKEYIKQYNPRSHRIFDENEYPNRNVVTDKGTVVQKINRIGIPFQKVIVKKGASFLFGTPVKLDCETGADAQLKEILTAVETIWKDNKLDSANRQLARNLASATQVAECWYVIKGESHNRYGFQTDIRLRMQVLSPMKGDFLYPYFDEFGDMVAFCRAYNRSVLVEGKSKSVPHFDVYTDEETVVYQQIDSVWKVAQLGTDAAGNAQLMRPNKSRKIPVVFAQQETVDWDDVQSMIERLEYLMSKFAETNDYHASPKLVITNGTIKNMAKKGESNSIFELEGGDNDNKPDMKYLSWDHATDAVKLEIETLLRFIYTFTQTPDLSFDSVKGLQAISGVALRMLLIDAHLKVQEKREIFDAYLERRLKLLINYVGLMNTKLEAKTKEISITPTIIPFEIEDQAEIINDLISATGGKAIMSQRSAIEKLGKVKDVEQELGFIREDSKQTMIQTDFEPAL